MVLGGEKRTARHASELDDVGVVVNPGEIRSIIGWNGMRVEGRKEWHCEDRKVMRHALRGCS